MLTNSSAGNTKSPKMRKLLSKGLEVNQEGTVPAGVTYIYWGGSHKVQNPYHLYAGKGCGFMYLIIYHSCNTLEHSLYHTKTCAYESMFCWGNKFKTDLNKYFNWPSFFFFFFFFLWVLSLKNWVWRPDLLSVHSYLIDNNHVSSHFFLSPNVTAHMILLLDIQIIVKPTAS